VTTIRDALGQDWAVVNVAAPAASDGDGGSGSDESVRAARGAEIYLGFGVPRGVLDAGRGTLRWVHSGTAGVGSSLAHLRGTGVVLTNSAGIHAEPMADWVLSALTYFARGLDYQLAAQRRAHWAKGEFADLAVPLMELRDVRVGLLGLGGIGRAVAARCAALGMRVAAVRRRPELGGAPEVAWVGGLADLPRLASESDCLVVAAPETGATAGAVTRTVLERLPAGAVVVNVSRGGLVDEDALLDLLQRGRLRGAALDVFAAEPLAPGHPFWAHPRVLVSPHVSAVSTRFWERETGLILDNIRRYLAGEELRNVVDLEAGY
jgi:phosphoglycerate dehydrogenase-like enzyme